MFKNKIFDIILIILVFVVHQTLVAQLNWSLNFWPAILVIILLTFDHKLALLWTLIIGFLLDFYSVLPFGSHLIILFFCLLICYLISKNFLTNRSLMSFVVLTFIFTLLFNLFMLVNQEIFIWLAEAQRIFLTQPVRTILIQVISNSIFSAVLFFIIYKFTKRLKSDRLFN